MNEWWVPDMPTGVFEPPAIQECWRQVRRGVDQDPLVSPPFSNPAPRPAGGLVTWDLCAGSQRPPVLGPRSTHAALSLPPQTSPSEREPSNGLYTLVEQTAEEEILPRSSVAARAFRAPSSASSQRATFGGVTTATGGSLALAEPPVFPLITRNARPPPANRPEPGPSCGGHDFHSGVGSADPPGHGPTEGSGALQKCFQLQIQPRANFQSFRQHRFCFHINPSHEPGRPELDPPGAQVGASKKTIPKNRCVRVPLRTARGTPITPPSARRRTCATERGSLDPSTKQRESRERSRRFDPPNMIASCGQWGKLQVVSQKGAPAQSGEGPPR